MLLTTGAADEESFAGDCGGLDGFELARTKSVAFEINSLFQLENNNELTITCDFLNRVRSPL